MTRDSSKTLLAGMSKADLLADINLLKVRVHKLEDDMIEMKAALAKLKGIPA